MTRFPATTFAKIVGLALVLLVSAPVVHADDQPVTDDTLIERLESAKTAADHEALAAYFRDKASAARRVAQRHQAMLVARTSKGPSPWHAHCTRLIKAYKKQATDYDSLAAVQEKMAKDTTTQQ